MKKNHLYIFALFFLLCQFAALFASAQVIAYITIQGVKTGQFKGGSIERGNEGKIDCIGFSYAVKTLLTASGLSSGRRFEGPVMIVKNFDASTPQLLQSLYTNETLSSVIIEFSKKAADGRPYTFQTITLTNAFVSQISQHAGTLSPDRANSIPTEEISLSFQKIEIVNHDGKTSANDNWNTIN